MKVEMREGRHGGRDGGGEREFPHVDSKVQAKHTGQNEAAVLELGEAFKALDSL